MNNPDNWVILKIEHEDQLVYKILAGWSGGYLDGDSWKMNSGITKFEEEDDHYLFHGYSGSVYHCHKEAETMRMNCAYVYDNLKKKIGDAVKIITVEDFKNEFKEPNV